MSVPETARDVIAEELCRRDEGWVVADYLPDADGVLDALAAAGFAVVRLPEPDMTGEHVWNETEGHPVANYFADGCDEWVMSCCGRVDVNGLPPDFSPTYARNLAARLLAAADHAEAGEDRG